MKGAAMIVKTLLVSAALAAGGTALAVPVQGASLSVYLGPVEADFISGRAPSLAPAERCRSKSCPLVEIVYTPADGPVIRIGL